jgi:hypothetical protein
VKGKMCELLGDDDISSPLLFENIWSGRNIWCRNPSLVRNIEEYLVRKRDEYLGELGRNIWSGKGRNI